MKDPLTTAEQALKYFGCHYERRPDGTIVVPGILNLTREHLTTLPDLSRVVVEGDFVCSYNQLTSLKGAPAVVTGSFRCDHNLLTSLEGAPASVGGDFYTPWNELVTLKGAPREMRGAFSCRQNSLTTLEGAPRIAGSFNCSENYLTSLEGAPEVRYDFNCANNDLISLKGAPARLEGSFTCIGNPRLASLEGGPCWVVDFHCQDNASLTLLEHAPGAFSSLHSDFGVFSSWEAIPEHLAMSQQTGELLEHEVIRSATELLRPAKAMRPLVLKFKM